MAKKIIIALAPTTGAGPGKGNPVRSSEIAAQVIAGVQAGAALVHLHARDENGALTTDLSAFNAAVGAIKSSCDIVLEASTGGLSTLTAEERALPAANPHAELASLNIGSLNFGDRVYQNSVPEIRYWIETLAARKIKPGLEIFDTGNLDFALAMIAEGTIKPPCNFGFVFDLRWGMSFDPVLLAWLVKRLPAQSRWGAIFVGSQDFSKHLEAARQGASFVRTGFEDSRDFNGRFAARNDELVAALREELERGGFALASAADARAMMLG